MKKFFKVLLLLLFILLICGIIYFAFISKNTIKQNNPSSSDIGKIDNSVSIDDIKSKIDDVIKNNENSENRKQIDDSINEEILGYSAKDYMNYFGNESVPATILLKDSSVVVVPAPDFINIQHFHYNDNGNLVAYVLEYSGIGGKITYYFNDGKLIDTITDVEELDNFSIEYEEEQDILIKSEKVYNKYMLDNN